jgi:L-fuculose-phosphate aldolase
MGKFCSEEKAMTEYEARQQVLEAGLRLIETGLIARTWGNVSCRVDDESFVITPTGRAYTELTPEELALCAVRDASTTGDVKPSIEKGIHAMVYRERKDAGFVIHTHQKWATALSACGISALGGSPVSAYAHAGTAKLVEKIRAVLPNAKDSLLIPRHGAVCFGPDLTAAFTAAQKLEESSQLLIIQKYMEQSGEKMPQSLRRVFDYCAKAGGGEELLPLTATSRRESDSFLFNINGVETRYTRISGDMPEEARLHEEIYRLRPDANFIESTADDAVVSFSLKNTALPSMLDDTAQMMGSAVNNAGDAPAGIVSAIKGGKRACLFTGRGGLSFAETKDEAVAGKLILEKNAAAYLCAELFGGVKPISAFECYLQHTTYKNKYSKKK